MDNHLGQYDPTNTDGPYFGGLRPFRQIRIRAFTEETDAPFTIGDSFVGGEDVLGTSVIPIGLFTGFVESWEQEWDPQPSPNPDASVTISAVDAFGVLAKMQGIALNSANYYSSDAIAAILDVVWPNAPRSFEQGTNVVDYTAESLANVLTTLQEFDASEGGLFFTAGDGTLRFYNKQHLGLYPPASADTWGDAVDERQYQNLSTSHDEGSIINDVTAMLFDGSVGASERDITSEAHYIRRRRTIDTRLTLVSQAQELALNVLARSSSAFLKITSMEVGVRDDIEWLDILNKDLLDRVTVKRRPLHTEPGIVQDSTIQRITINSSSRWHWSIVWTLTATLRPNLLTELQASFEGSVAGWSAVSNCTLAHVAANAHVGAECMTLTSVAAGDMSAHVVPVNDLPVVPGLIYSAVASFQSASIGRFCHVQVNWLDSGLAAISSVQSSDVNDGTTAYTNASLTAQAPAGAAYAELLVVVLGTTAAGQVHRIDTVGFFEGEQTAWTPGNG
jgi:hypothetical protein